MPSRVLVPAIPEQREENNDMRRALAATSAAVAALVLHGVSALACGGLVAPDGDVRLAKATTFVAWQSGVEHYVTSFAYQGSAVDLGWIVPLPAVPDRIEPAGRWTLQRLELEVQPPRRLLFAPEAAASDALVVEHVQVEALDVSVLKGSGDQVVSWCAHNGFALDTETRDHLLRYAAGSPVFMAAKYDTSIAQRRGLAQGDGVPLMLTMRTERLWVPLEVLANDGARVDADLFLLTPGRPFSTSSLPAWPPLPGFSDGAVDGAPGFVIAKQEAMNPSLHADLARDRNMAWLPANGWLTYLTLDAPAEQVTYDLSLGSDNLIRLDAFGGARGTAPGISGQAGAVFAIAAGGAAAVCVALVALLPGRRRRAAG
jgi:hypothetical protein